MHTVAYARYKNNPIMGNTMKHVINKKPTVRVKLTEREIALIKSELVPGSGIIYQALYYSGIHYNTLFKSALLGKPIKKEQRDKLVEFCKSVKQEKAA